MTAATRRAPVAHLAPGAPGVEAPPDLASAVRAAIGYLGDLNDPPEAVRDGRLDRMLRASVESYLGGAARGEGRRTALDEAAAAVRTACAHLAATELEDAYLALRAAFDRLPRRGGPDGSVLSPAGLTPHQRKPSPAP